MKKTFRHTVSVYSQRDCYEHDDIMCHQIVRKVNEDIKLYGKVCFHHISRKYKTYSFLVELSDHHGPNAKAYIRGLINGILIEKGMDIQTTLNN